MINEKAGVFFSRKYFRAAFSGSRQLSVFTISLVLSLLFFNSFVNVQISEAKGKSVSSVAFTAGQSAALTYGTAATVTFKVIVNITGTGTPPSVYLSTSPAVSGVTYAWYNSSNTTVISWPQKVSSPTTYTLRVTTAARAAATAGTTITVTDSGSGKSGTGTLTINRAALTITAARNTKTYDGTTSVAAKPGVTGLKGSDTVTGLAEAYVDKTAGTNKTIDVTAYTVNDGNNGNNYSVATVSNTDGVINTKTLTVKGITANDKVYDGNTSATLNTGGAALVGVISGDNVQLVTGTAVGTFSDSEIGANKTVYVSDLTLSGTDAGNYSLTQPTTTASITGPNVNVNPSSPFDFGSVNVGLPSSPQTFTINNIGNTGLQIETISSDNAEFALSNDNCSGQTIPASGSCTLQVTFTPSTFESRGAILTIPSNDPDTAFFLITLNGMGIAANIGVSPASPVDFRSVNVGSSSSPRTLTINNSGNTVLVIGAIDSSNAGEFALSNDNCSGQTVAAAGNCTLQVTFAPSTFGSRSAILTIPSNDPGALNFLVTLDGTGTAANIVVSPSSPFDFGSVNVGLSSSPQIFTINNTGNTGLVIGTITSDNTDFVISNDNCTWQTIPASSNCTLQVTFTPLTSGSRGATLTIPSNAPNSPTFVTLTGSGNQVPYTLNVIIAGNGRVDSSPLGISCVGGSGCSTQFNASSTVTLTATNLDICLSLITWSGPCSGNGSVCDVPMTVDPTTENVTFTILLQVKNMGTGLTYSAIQDAYDNANSDDVLRASSAVYDSPVFDLPKDVTVQGGHDCNFTDPIVGFTTFNTLNGSMPAVISGGSVVLDGVVIN